MKLLRTSRVVAGGALVLSAACHDSTGPTVKPAGIRLVAGDGQTAPAGTTLATAPQFVAFDASGAAIGDVKFTVSVSSGGGKIVGAPGRTVELADVDRRVDARAARRREHDHRVGIGRHAARRHGHRRRRARDPLRAAHTRRAQRPRR